VELLSITHKPIEVLEFDQEVIIRIHVKFEQDAGLVIGYLIRDDKNLEILSSSTWQESGRLVIGRKGSKLVVEFKTKLPLIDGNYNIQTVLSIPVSSKIASYVDLTENAIVFRVLEKKPKIWSKVYLKNQVKINGAKLS
jgi:hypothetical protein